MTRQKLPAAPAEAGPTTSITFAENSHDFGTIDEGDVVTHIFTFTNTGDNPLILDKCKGSCGCTVPQCPKEPIAPGATGEIEVKFNSKGKKNKQTEDGHHQCQHRPEEDLNHHFGQRHPRPGGWRRQVIRNIMP